MKKLFIVFIVLFAIFLINNIQPALPDIENADSTNVENQQSDNADVGDNCKESKLIKKAGSELILYNLSNETIKYTYLSECPIPILFDLNISFLPKIQRFLYGYSSNLPLKPNETRKLVFDCNVRYFYTNVQLHESKLFYNPNMCVSDIVPVVEEAELLDENGNPIKPVFTTSLSTDLHTITFYKPNNLTSVK